MKRISLDEGYPDIAKEWNAKRNGCLSSKASISSKAWVWWQCQNNPEHQWEQPVYKRIKGKGCPICAIEPKSLKNLFPELAAEWHPTLNGDVGPGNVAGRGSHMAWWLCAKNSSHVWQAKVDNRTAKRRTGCPYCAGKQADASNSFASLCPELLLQWHPTKNTIDPNQVTCGSRKKAWWLCPKDEEHVWQADITSRTGADKAGCPFCAHKYVTDKNRLSVVAPEIAAEWHPTKNRIAYTDLSRGTFFKEQNKFIAPHEREAINKKRLKASDMPYASRETAWWQCQAAGHEWQARISSRTVDGRGCPYCSGRKVIPGETSLASKYPALIKRWHMVRNKPLTPDLVAPMIDLEVWWICHRSADHIWKAPISYVVKAYKGGHTGCPYCNGRKIGKDNSLAAKFPNQVKEMWHPKKNDHIKPTEVTPGSLKLVWWQCPVSATHEWERAINTVTSSWKKGYRGCPFCRHQAKENQKSLKVDVGN